MSDSVFVVVQREGGVARIHEHKHYLTRDDAEFALQAIPEDVRALYTLAEAAISLAPATPAHPHDPKPLSEQDIQRVAALNVVIDELMQEQRALLDHLKRAVEGIKPIPDARLTSYEKNARGNKMVNFGDGPWSGVRNADDIAEVGARLSALEEFIRSLVQMKLSLFGDVDFSGGDEIRSRMDAAADQLRGVRLFS